MKRTFLLFALLAASFISTADQLPSPSMLAEGNHTEFKYHGFYGVIDYTFMLHPSGEYGTFMDQNGTVHSFEDQYMLHGLTAVVGWQWRKETGLGLGFSYLSDAEGSFSQIPVFVELRSHFLRSRVTPFTVLQLGYSIPFGSKNADADYTRIEKGGITAGFEGGVRFAISEKVGMNLYVGIQLINLNSVERGFDAVAATRLPEVYHNLKAGVGINF